MIHTRLTIFTSLKRMLKEVRKHGRLDPLGFKAVLYAVILNDMREWSLYIYNTEDRKVLDQILEDYIIKHKEFQIERFVDDPDLYRNVNTPLDNTTWIQILPNDVIEVTTIQ